MTILYRGPHGLVTSDIIATVHMGWSRMPVRDLTAIHIVRTRPDGSRRLLGLSALVIVLLTVPLIGWPAVVLAVVVLIATTVLAMTTPENAAPAWVGSPLSATRPLNSAPRRSCSDVTSGTLLES